VVFLCVLCGSVVKALDVIIRCYPEIGSVVFSASSAVHALDVMVLALVCGLPDAEGEALEEDQKSGVAVEAEIQARAGQQAHP